MWTALASGSVGVMLTALSAWVLDAHRERRRRDEKDDHDVWAAIGGLRTDVSKNSEHLAEIRGLLTGLYAELLGDAELVGRFNPPPVVPHRRRTREE